MTDLLSIACLPDHPPGRSVDLLAPHTWSHSFDAGLLCEPHDLVHFANLRGWFADADSAGGVRPVAVPETSEVQHNRITRLDHPIPRLMVRIGPIGTRPDDCEVDLLVSELSQQISKTSSDFGLPP